MCGVEELAVGKTRHGWSLKRTRKTIRGFVAGMRFTAHRREVIGDLERSLQSSAAEIVRALQTGELFEGRFPSQLFQVLPGIEKRLGHLGGGDNSIRARVHGGYCLFVLVTPKTVWIVIEILDRSLCITRQFHCIGEDILQSKLLSG